jgi:quinol monooxygenase YgiN
MSRTLGFLVTLHAKPGREDEVVAFLETAERLVHAEPGTKQWFGFRVDATTFGIFDTFDTESDRDSHLHGEVRKALEANAELFDRPPVIAPVDVVGIKVGS